MHKGITTVVTVAKNVHAKSKHTQDIFNYNSLTHFPKVIILVPKDSSLQELFNGIISFDICSTLAEI